jgi:hypothetical protein
MRKVMTLAALAIMVSATASWAHFGDILFAVQFPDENIPTIDGNLSDWDVASIEPYEVGNDQMGDSFIGRGVGEIDVSDLSLRQVVGWNDNTDQLYFAAEVFDNVHNADREDPGQFWADDAWEIYMSPSHPEADGGGPYTPGEGGITRQSFNFALPPVGGNYGQFMPDFEWRTDPFNNDVWGVAWSFEGEEFGESTYFYELWVQPIDFIPDDGDRDSVEETDLEEGLTIALSWTFGDFDEPGTQYQGFWSISPNGCCRADNDMIMAELDDSIDWGAQVTAVEDNTWGRIKSEFSK